MRSATGAISSFILTCALTGAFACAGDTRQPTYDSDIELKRTLEQVAILGAESSAVTFDDVRGYATDSLGRIWVAEWDATIHLFGPDYRHLRTWKKVGEGPGEFDNITAMDVDRATGRVVISDSDQITILTGALEFVARWDIPFPARRTTTMSGIRFEHGGASLLVPIPLKRDSVMVDSVRLVWSDAILLRMGVDGKVMDTVASLIGRWMRLTPKIGSSSRDPSFGDAIWLPLGEHGTVVADGQRTYSLQLLSQGGDTLRTIKRKLQKEVIFAGDGPEVTRGFVHRATFDSKRGEILACRTQPHGKGNLQPGVVDYFNLNGAYLGSMEWPACPRHVGPDGNLYTVVQDSLGVSTIRSFRYAGEPQRTPK